MGHVELRPARPDEIGAICALSNRALVHDRIPRVFVEAELAEELAMVDAAADVRVAEIDGVVSGYAYVWYVPSGERLERTFVFGTVEPARRGQGIGQALLQWAIARATEQLRAVANDLPKVIRADASEQVEDAHLLLARMGFEPVRWFEDLLRPLGDPPAVEVPAGYAIVDWPAARDAELCAVRNEAFADHWGSPPWSETRFAEVIAGYGVRTDLSVVAVERGSGEIVGLCLNDHYPQDAALLGRTDGWISVLGTRAAHRGRGLASAMVNASLRRFASAGFTHAAIGVDADSPTGAHRLYRSLGFAPDQRHTAYEICVA